MAISLFPRAPGVRAATGFGRDAPDEPGGDVSGDRSRRGGAGQRHLEKIFEVRLVPGLYAIQQLFHDHALPHPGASTGNELDLGPVDRHRALRRADLAGAALRPDADPESEVSGSDETTAEHEWTQMNEQTERLFIRVNRCSSVLKDFGGPLMRPATGQETDAAIPSASCTPQASRRTRHDQSRGSFERFPILAATRVRRCCSSAAATRPNHPRTPRRGRSFRPFV